MLQAEKLKRIFDWGRIRQQVIEPLLNGRLGMWYSCGTHSIFSQACARTAHMEWGEPKERKLAQMILIEGAHSASTELADLVDMAILIEVPTEERHARTYGRIKTGSISRAEGLE